MAYLTCPTCGITVFDRNPLLSPQYCPRCAERRGLVVELLPAPRFPGGAAASLLVRPPALPPPVEEPE